MPVRICLVSSPPCRAAVEPRGFLKGYWKCDVSHSNVQEIDPNRVVYLRDPAIKPCGKVEVLRGKNVNKDDIDSTGARSHDFSTPGAQFQPRLSQSRSVVS